MTKFSKKVCTLFLVLMLTTLLAGCTGNEMKLYNAMNKMQDVESMESNTDIDIAFEITGLPEEQQQSVQPVTEMLKDTTITSHQKMIQNEDQTVAKAQMNTEIKIGQMLIDMPIWVDMDISGEEPQVKEIFKLPLMLKMFMPEEFGDKEYVVYDFNDMMSQEEDIELDYTKLLNFSKDLQPQLMDTLKGFDLGEKIVKYKGKKKVDGKYLSLYEVKLDDDSFKSLLRNSTKNLLKSEDVMELMQQFLVSSMDLVDAPADETKEAQEQLTQGFSDMEESIPEFIENVDKFFNAFEDVKILGDKGLRIQYGINSAGYVVSESGTVDMVIDGEAIEAAVQKLSATEENSGDDSLENKSGVVALTLNFDTEIFNINKKLEINMPELNDDNSILFTDLVNSMEPDLDPNSIKVNLNDNPLIFDVQPTIVNGRVLVPARGVFEALGAEINWDEANQEVTGVKDDMSIVLHINSTDAVVNSEHKTLDVPATIINGRTIVPLRFISENFGVKVEWNEETRTVNMSSN